MRNSSQVKVQTRISHARRISRLESFDESNGSKFALIGKQRKRIEEGQNYEGV
jgi:hypothetical protein